MEKNARDIRRYTFAAASVSLLLVVFPAFASAALFNPPLGSSIFNLVIQRLCELQQARGNRVILVDPARCAVTPPPPSTATLTLQKIVINDNGGAAVDMAWTLSANGPTPISGMEGTASTTNATVAPGTYDLSESGPSGYSASGWSCTGGTQVDSNTVSILAGQQVTCTITNNDTAPSLTLNKIVINNDGGTQPESAWTLDAAGPTSIFGPGGTTSADVVSGPNFQAGTYILSEVGPTGYSAVAWVCTGGGQQNGAEITILPGENVTCTITNDDNPPPPPTFTVTVHKYIEGTHATATSAESMSFPIESMWMAPLGATTTATSSLTTGNAYMTVSSAVATGTSYTTKELTDGSAVGASCANGKPFALQGYTVGNTEAEAAAMAPDMDAPFLANITSNMHIIIWNMDCTPMLRVTKIVINDDGGTATTSDFALFIDGATTTSGMFMAVATGTHAVSETNMTGYTAAFGGACNASGQVTLAAGERQECTITNNDNPPPGAPMLTVTKVVVNNNGGTATTSDFTLYVDGMPIMSGMATTTTAGTHTVTESATSSYTASFGGDCNSSGQVTLAAGQSKTCIVTNDDVAQALPGSITITKMVVNDSGGTATSSDFMIHLHVMSGTTTMDVAGSPQAGSATGTTYSNLAAGSYHVAEAATSTYSVTFSGDCDSSGNISLGEGQSKTCTVTNNDNVQLTGELLITEVLYNLSNSTTQGDEPENEWVEIYNGMNVAVDLSGYTVTDNSGTASTTLLNGVTLQSGKYLVLTGSTSTASFWTIPGDAVVVVDVGGSIGNGLRNAGDVIVLKNPTELEVDAVSWGDNTDAFEPAVAAAFDGYSIVRTSPTTDTDDAADWTQTPSPTPGS